MAPSTCAGCAGERTVRELAVDTIAAIAADLGDDVRVYEVECLTCGEVWEEQPGLPPEITPAHIAPMPTRTWQSPVEHGVDVRLAS